MNSQPRSNLPPNPPPSAPQNSEAVLSAQHRAAVRAANKRRRLILAFAIMGYILVPVGITVAFRSQIGIHRSDADRAMAPWQMGAGLLIIAIGVGLVIAARILYRPAPMVRRCQCGYSGLCRHERGEERVGSMPMTDFLCAAFSVGWNPICPQCGNRWS